jgi:hypothetical protein
MKIDDREIDSLTTFKQELERIAEKRPEKVRFLVLRDIETRFLFIETDWDSLAVK